LRRMFWVKYHLNHLRNWRRAVNAVAEALDDLEVDAELYVIGGAAENRLTVLSDIDLLLCVKETYERSGLGRLRRRLLALAMDKYGLPLDYPIELHIMTIGECREQLNRLGEVIKLR